MPSVPFCNLEDTFSSEWEKKVNGASGALQLPTFKNANSCVARNDQFQNSIANNQFNLQVNPLNVGGGTLSNVPSAPVDTAPTSPVQINSQQINSQQINSQQINSQLIPQVLQSKQNQQVATDPMSYQYQYVPVVPYQSCPIRVPQYYPVYQQYPQNLRLPGRWGFQNSMIQNSGLQENFGNYNSIEYFDSKNNAVMKHILISILVIYGIYLVFDILS